MASLSWAALAAVSSSHKVSAQSAERGLVEALRASPAAREPAPAPSGAVALATEGDRPALARSPRQIRVPLRIQGSGSAKSLGEDFRVTDGDARITTDPNGESSLELNARGRTVVSSSGAPETAKHSTIAQAKTALPWLLIDAQDTAQGPHIVATRPFLQLARAIRWDPETKHHLVELWFGVDPEPGHEHEIDSPLDPPFRARFSVSCDEVVPAEAEITRVGPAGYDLVRVACSPAVKNESETQWIEIHVGSGNLRYPFELPHRPGAPLLLASSASLAGFGLGATTLTVQLLEEDGSPLSAAESERVQLIASGGGTLVPSTLTIPAGQREASVELHPSGLGKVEITAVLGDLRSQPVRLSLAWPWMALLAMLAGGLIGAFLAFVRSRRKRGYRRSVADVLSGVLLSCATLLLPQLTTLPSWARPTEVGFLLIAAAAAFLGLDAFEALVRRLLPSVPPKNASPVTK